MSSENPSFSAPESSVRVPYTGRRAMRRDLVHSLARNVARGERLPDDLMLATANYLEIIQQEDSQKVNAAASLLFTVYESHADLNDNDIVNKVHNSTGINSVHIDLVFDWLFDKRYLQMSDDEQAIVFGTPGLWLLEDAFMQGGESVDSMAVAERNLRQAGFFQTS